jgi:hypothetical protein
MILKLATTASDLHDKLHRIFSDNEKFLTRDNSEISQLTDEIDKLGKIDATSRSLLLVRLNTLLGDREQADYYLRNAKRLYASDDDYALAEFTMLIALGYISEALPVLKKCLEPSRNLQNIFLNLPPPTGFHLLQSAYKHARELGMTNTPVELPYPESVTEIMDFWGDSDADYALMFDHIGTVLRAHGLLFGTKNFSVQPFPEPLDGSAPYVKFSLSIEADFETAIDLTCEYMDHAAKSAAKIPPSMIFEFDSVYEYQS